MADIGCILSKYTGASELSSLLESDKFGIYAAKTYLKMDGITDDYTALYNLINTTINGSKSEIWFKDGTALIGSNITIPSNIKLVFLNGGVLKPSTGKVITGSNAKIEAGLTQIFDLSASGSSGLTGTWDADKFYAEWFGATGNGLSDDSTALNYAIACTPSYKNIILSKHYVIRSSLNIINKSYIRITGGGKIQIPSSVASVTAFKMAGTCNFIEIDSLEIYGDGSTASQYAIDNNSGQTISNVRIYNCYIHDLGLGISLNANLGGTFNFAWVYNNKIYNIVGTSPGSGYGISLAKVYYADVYGNFIDNCHRHSIYQGSGYSVGVNIRDNIILNHRSTVADSSPRPAIVCSRSSGVKIYNNTIMDYKDGALIIDHETSSSTYCYDIEVFNNNFINRKNAVSSVYIGQQLAPGTYYTYDIRFHGNKIYSDNSISGGGTDILIWNGTGIDIYNNKIKSINESGTRYCIEVGDNSFVSKAADCSDIVLKDNVFELSGTLTNIRCILFCLDVSTNFKSNILAKNNRLVATGGTLYYPESNVAVTNEFLVFETKDNVFQANYSSGDTSPSIYRKNFIVITNSGATNITTFDDGIEGQLISLFFSDGNTTLVHNASYIVLSGAANFTSATGNVMQLIYKNGVFYEVSRRT